MPLRESTLEVYNALKEHRRVIAGISNDQLAFETRVSRKDLGEKMPEEIEKIQNKMNSEAFTKLAEIPEYQTVLRVGEQLVRDGAAKLPKVENEGNTESDDVGQFIQKSLLNRD